MPARRSERLVDAERCERGVIRRRVVNWIDPRAEHRRTQHRVDLSRLRVDSTERHVLLARSTDASRV